MLLAYKNDPQLRKDFLAEMRKHQKLDQIVQGTYAEGSNGDFRGCHIGCAIHSLNKIKRTNFSTSDHTLLKTHLGIPVEIAYLFDGLFEALPVDDAKKFPLECAKAIKCGADLSLVIPQFLLWLLADPKDGVIRFVQGEEFKQQREAVEGVAELHRRTIAGQKPKEDEWAAARAAARDAARDAARAAARDAASYAARDAASYAASAAASYAASAAASAAAWDAARATASAAARATASAAASYAASYAASAAAWDAARATARAAAWNAATKRMAEKLIELLENA